MLVNTGTFDLILHITYWDVYILAGDVEMLTSGDHIMQMSMFISMFCPSDGEDE
jgi:hypothetical protein